MTSRITALAALLSPSLLTATAAAQPVAAPPTPPQTAQVAEASAHDRLFKLFKDSDEASLKRNPISALFRGDMRYADQLGDYITDEYFAKERAAGEADLAGLHAIDRNALNATDQLAYDVFEFTTKDTLKNLTPEMLALTTVRPLNHFFGFHTFYPTLASGKGTAPFKTVADYDNNLKRHKEFVTLMDRSIGRFRQGMESGVVETKLTIRNVIEQLDTQLKQKPEESPYYGPIGVIPASFSAAEKARLTTAYRASITTEIYPALTRLRDFLKND